MPPVWKGGVLALGLCSTGYALQFEHLMNIGSRGSGNGQFKYVEDFAIDAKGGLLATDAANSNIQVFKPIR